MSAGHLTAMSNTAFAGLLRLVLTPLNDTPELTHEVRAYLDYLRVVDRSAEPARDPETPSCLP